MTRRLRASWTSWSLTRTRRREARALQRLLLLQTSLDSQHLLVKELRQREQLLLHRQQEMAESLSYHLQQALPLLPASPSSPLPSSTELDRVLGLSTPAH